jgi:hypothetical protein
MHDRGFGVRGVFNTLVDNHAGAIQADFLFKNTMTTA